MEKSLYEEHHSTGVGIKSPTLDSASTSPISTFGKKALKQETLEDLIKVGR